MKTGRNTLVRVILALGAAGSIAASVTIPVVAAAAPAATASAPAAARQTYFHG